MTKLPRSVRSPGCGSCAKTCPTGTSALSVRSTSSFSPASWICWTASRSTLPTTSGTATGLAALSCDCTSCHANQPPTSASATIEHAEEPGPDRTAPRRLVVLVVAAGRVRRRSRCGGRADRRRRLVGAREHRRRRLGRLGGDADPARDPLEIGVHLLGGVVAVGGILRERAQRDVVEVARDLGAVRRGWGGNLREVLHRDLDRRLAVERDAAGEQLVEDDPGRVEVGGLVDRGTARLLGREVLRGADDRAGLGHLARRAGARDPEVHHLDAALAVDDHVVRLDVAVDDPVPVREAQRREDLARVVDRDPERRRAARDEQLLQRPPLDVLHRDVVRPLGLAAVVDRDDARMREPGGVLRLAAEALDELLVAGVPVVEDLDRDAAAELLVGGEVDVRHPARAELPDDQVAPVEEAVDEVVARGHKRTG